MSNVFQPSRIGLALTREDGIVKGNLAEALSSAELVLQEARTSAEKMIENAEASCREIEKNAYEEGLAKAKLELAGWLLDAKHHLDRRLERMQTEVADLVGLCVRRVITSFDERELTTEIVRSALASLRSEKRVQLFLAQGAEATIRSELVNLLAEYPEIELVDIIVDPTLHANAMRLECELGVVSFDLEQSIAQLVAILRGGAVLRTTGSEDTNTGSEK